MLFKVLQWFSKELAGSWHLGLMIFGIPSTLNARFEKKSYRQLEKRSVYKREEGLEDQGDPVPADQDRIAVMARSRRTGNFLARIFRWIS